MAPSGTIAKQQGAEQEADAFEIAIVNSGCGGARLGTSQTPRALGGSGFGVHFDPLKQVFELFLTLFFIFRVIATAKFCRWGFFLRLLRVRGRHDL